MRELTIDTWVIAYHSNDVDTHYHYRNHAVIADWAAANALVRIEYVRVDNSGAGYHAVYNAAAAPQQRDASSVIAGCGSHQRMIRDVLDEIYERYPHASRIVYHTAGVELSHLLLKSIRIGRTGLRMTRTPEKCGAASSMIVLPSQHVPIRNNNRYVTMDTSNIDVIWLERDQYPRIRPHIRPYVCNSKHYLSAITMLMRIHIENINIYNDAVYCLRPQDLDSKVLDPMCVAYNAHQWYQEPYLLVAAWQHYTQQLREVRNRDKHGIAMYDSEKDTEYKLFAELAERCNTVNWHDELLLQSKDYHMSTEIKEYYQHMAKRLKGTIYLPKSYIRHKKIKPKIKTKTNDLRADYYTWKKMAKEKEKKSSNKDKNQ